MMRIDEKGVDWMGFNKIGREVSGIRWGVMVVVVVGTERRLTESPDSFSLVRTSNGCSYDGSALRR